MKCLDEVICQLIACYYGYNFVSKIITAVIKIVVTRCSRSYLCNIFEYLNKHTSTIQQFNKLSIGRPAIPYSTHLKIFRIIQTKYLKQSCITFSFFKIHVMLHIILETKPNFMHTAHTFQPINQRVSPSPNIVMMKKLPTEKRTNIHPRILDYC